MYIVGLKRFYLKIPGIGECRYKTKTMPEVVVQAVAKPSHFLILRLFVLSELI